MALRASSPPYVGGGSRGDSGLALVGSDNGEEEMRGNSWAAMSALRALANGAMTIVNTNIAGGARRDYPSLQSSRVVDS